MLTDGIQVMKYCRASAGRAGLSVVFEDVNQPRHDGSTIYLPRITYKTTEMELKQLMASVDHEVAHDKFSCFDVLKEKKADPKGLLMFVWNFLEDSRINIIEAKEYNGFKENWDDCSSLLVTDILSKTKKERTTMSVLVEALLYWEARISAYAFPQIELAASHVTPNKKIVDVLSNFTDRLIHCHEIVEKKVGTEATFKLAEDILNELDKECKEELPKPKPTPKKGEGEEGDKDGKGAKSSSDEGKAGDTSDSKGEGGSKKDDSDYKIIEVVVTAEDLDKFSLSIPEESGMSKVGINFKPVKSERSDWDLTDFNKFMVIDYPKNTGADKYRKEKTAEHIAAEYEWRVVPKLITQENFAQQVRRLIQIRAKVQRVYGVKKGKLDQSRLSRICFNAPGFNERVFKNKIENKTLDAAITVLVDKSGSMSGEKDLFAMASTLLVNEVCSTLNIPLEILGFTDDVDEREIDRPIVPVMYVYKNFSDTKVSDEDLRKYYGMSSRFMHGNPDAENILWAHDRLVKRKEKKKLLIVMSDGSPAATKGGSGIGRFTENVIREIETSNNVEIYGLGLCSDSVKHYYKSNSVVNEPEDIPTKLLELIERKILR
jgi:cobalamin biosynthesis protein CobT